MPRGTSQNSETCISRHGHASLLETWHYQMWLALVRSQTIDTVTTECWRSPGSYGGSMNLQYDRHMHSSVRCCVVGSLLAQLHI